MNNKLRVSYSLLQMWQKDKEEAIQNYLHVEREKTPAMLYGIERHQVWQDTIKELNKITLGSKTYTFKEPSVEHEIIKDYNENFLVKGYIDCLDDKTIYEFKTGRISASQYSHTFQIPFYFMLCDMAEIPIEKAIIIHEDQGMYDSAIVWYWPEMVDEAKNWVDTIAPDIMSYFEEHAIPL